MQRTGRPQEMSRTSPLANLIVDLEYVENTAKADPSQGGAVEMAKFSPAMNDKFRFRQVLLSGLRERCGCVPGAPRPRFASCVPVSLAVSLARPRFASL